MAGRSSNRKPRRPALTLEGRENQLASLAADLVERRLIDGTASATETIHLLKLGSTREKLEQERLHRENLLLSAKVDQMASSSRMEELYGAAISAMRTYSGQDPGYPSDDGYDDEYDS